MVQSTKVLFLFKVRVELQGYLRAGLEDLTTVELLFLEDTSEEVLLDKVLDVDVLVGWRPTAPLLAAAQNAKLFINPGAGIQHLIPLFRTVNKERNLPLVNGHGNAYFTAQHAFAMTLAMCNCLVPHHQWMLEGRWRIGDKEAPSIPLRAQKLGLLGYGAVNKTVHQMLAGFGCEIAVLRNDWTKQKTALPTKAKRYSPSALLDFLTAIDLLIIAVPQTAKTEGLIDAKGLAALGANGRLVNISRGPVVVEQDLYEALKNKTIAGAAIDVWYEYRPVEDSEGRKRPFHFPFHELPNVLLSPHRAASPFSDLNRWWEVVENIRRVAAGRIDVLNLVDLAEEY